MKTLSWVSRIALLGMASSLSSGCIMYRLEELRHATPQGSAFQNELSRLYMDYATQEEKLYDWRDSWYFADKGLMLAYGKDREPELLEDWDIPDGVADELTKARIRVMDTLTPQMKQANPSTAAAIQFYFDCWVEQVDERAEADEVDYCRDGLNRALGGGSRMAAAPVKPVVKKAEAKPMPEEKLAEMPVAKSAPAEPVALKDSKPAPKPESTPFGGPTPEPAKKAEDAKPATKAENAAKEEPKKPKAPTLETASYAVFFEPKKADISTPGKNVLAEVTGSLKGKQDYAVVLHIAAKDGEKELAAQRLAAVRKVLADGGVDSAAVYDEIPPKDAARVARRVELFLNE